MFAQILDLLLGTAANLLALAFLARVWMQRVRAPFRNPVGQFVAAVTDWAVLPLRRLVPGLFGIDLASVFAAWFVQIAYFGVMVGLAGMAASGPEAIFGVAWAAGVAVLRMFVYLLMGVVIVMALLSWVNPYAPITPLFDQMARPLLQPIRRLLPSLGGVDLSPLVALVLCQVVLVVLANLPGFWPR
ncbi:YggT family protein [Pseudomonas sp.]|uniref:YggT family protein n=1 Tax=Pseudomonas sp. TaxID=306 RepID=UPI0023578218|nr:YggT family protein [Pseudomonas sp.]